MQKRIIRSLTGRKVTIGMAEKYKAVSILDLRNGKIVRCSKCGKGNYIPYNAEAEKAHLFICSSCGNRIHIDPPVIVE